MWRLLSLFTLTFLILGAAGCSFENTPKRLMAYLPQASSQDRPESAHTVLPAGKVSAALVVLNDTRFDKSAPALRKGTLHHLGVQLKAELEKQLPLNLSEAVFPEDVVPEQSSEAILKLAKDQGVLYVLLAVLSSSEWEVFDRLPLSGLQQPTGLRSSGLPGYRVENYARLELALVDAQTGQSVMDADGQAWATLERLAVPLESNVYPVVRRALTQPPIYPDSEGEAHETLRWVAGQDAIAQAVMHLGEGWKKKEGTPGQQPGTGAT